MYWKELAEQRKKDLEGMQKLLNEKESALTWAREALEAFIDSHANQTGSTDGPCELCDRARAAMADATGTETPAEQEARHVREHWQMHEERFLADETTPGPAPTTEE